MSRKFRGWYSLPEFVLTLSKVQSLAKTHDIKLADPENPTPKELQQVYRETFAEMSDPWEVTANGTCKVEEI